MQSLRTAACVCSPHKILLAENCPENLRGKVQNPKEPLIKSSMSRVADKIAIIARRATR